MTTPLTFVNRVIGSTFIMPDGRTLVFDTDGLFTTDRADEIAALSGVVSSGSPTLYIQEAQAEAVDPDPLPSVVDAATGH
jgi:hypothetical protein